MPTPIAKSLKRAERVLRLFYYRSSVKDSINACIADLKLLAEKHELNFPQLLNQRKDNDHV